MRKWLRNLVYCTAACACLGQASVAASNLPKAKSNLPLTVQYEVSLHSKRYGNKGMASFKMKGDKMCWERKTGGGLWLFLIRNEDGLFLVDRTTKKVGKYPPNSPRNSPMRLIPGPAGDPQQFLKNVNAKKISAADANSKRTEVWSYVEPETQWRCQLYMSRKTKAPVKLVMTGANEKADTITVTYKSFNTGVGIPDSVFKLPEGYPVRDMPTPGSRKTRKQSAQAALKSKEERTISAGPEAGYASKQPEGAQCRPDPRSESDEKQEEQADGDSG